MRLAAFAIAFLGALSGLVVPAASADTLRVTGDGVNVRAGPDLSAAVLLQVHSDEEVVGLDRDHPWVRVGLPDRDLEGWIHRSLLAPAAEAAAGQGGPVIVAPATPHGAADTGSDTGPEVEASRPTVQAAAASVDQVALERFRGSVDYINRRVTRIAGAGLFSGAEAVGPGEVRVVATDLWTTIPPGGRKSYLNILYLRWAAVTESGGPLRVEVVDESGELLREKRGS